MRRSIRDALVGFTVLGGIFGFSLMAMWMRGIKIGSNHWTVTAKFNDASGLAERSPVTYRGIIIGSVKSVQVSPAAVIAEMHIDHGKLRLSQPVVATVSSESLLGGNAEVALKTRGKLLPDDAPLPYSRDCSPQRQLCDGAVIRGEEAPSITTVIESMQLLLSDFKSELIVPNLADSTSQIDLTAKEVEMLVLQLRKDLDQVVPVLQNLRAASANAVDATAKAKNILGAIDNQKTISYLIETAANAAQLTSKLNTVGGELEKLISDKDFISGLRSVTIGLGELLEDIYSDKNNKM